MSFDQFVEECKRGGLPKAKELLRKFVSDGEPRGFCEGASSRAMCREASNAITGEAHRGYINTAHGVELYFYMWGSD